MTSDRNKSPPDAGPDMVGVNTLVLWLTAAVVGIVGWLIHPPGPARIAAQPPIEAELINVQTAPAHFSAPAAASVQRSVVQQSSGPPAPPALVAADFAVPPTQEVIQPRAMPAKIPTTMPGVIQPRAMPAQMPTTMPAVIQLTLGEGEGNQPAPDYPVEAAIAGQEGSVGVRFTVGEEGWVSSVELAPACRWPLLNTAALRTVRELWRFRAGPPRVYQVTIEFRLKRQEEP
jgi:protein TonB